MGNKTPINSQKLKEESDKIINTCLLFCSRCFHICSVKPFILKDDLYVSLYCKCLYDERKFMPFEDLLKLSSKKKVKDNYFLEYAEYAGNYYGTPKEKIVEKLDKGFDVILVIEIQGAKKIKDLVPEALFIFIMPPSEKELLKRLSNRKTEDKEKILERFNIAYKEMNEVTKYNYVVVNDKLEDAVEKVESIIKAEKCRVDRIEEVLVANKEEVIHEFLMDEEFDNTRIKEKLEVEE